MTATGAPAADARATTTTERKGLVAVATQLTANVRLRLEALRLAVEMHGDRGDRDRDQVTATFGAFLELLTARPVSLTVGRPVVADQDDPAAIRPAYRSGEAMAVSMSDMQECTYPAPSEADSKGFPVTGDQITISESSGGTVVQQTDNPDGSVTFVAVAPGTSQVSWTDGTLTFADTINVTPGDAASLVVGAPTVTEQPSASGTSSTGTADTGTSAAATDTTAAAADPAGSLANPGTVPNTQN